MTQQQCDWNGRQLSIHDMGATWSDAPGIYIFAGRSRNNNFWQPHYIGKAASFKDRFSNHERWKEAQRQGATHVHAVVVHSDAERDKIEQELIALFQPALNTHYK